MRSRARSRPPQPDVQPQTQPQPQPEAQRNGELPQGAAASATPLLDQAAAPPQRYVVQRGDTLSHIAAAYGTTVAAIASANGIADPNRIRIGQTLTIGGGSSGAGATSGSGATSGASTGGAATSAPAPSDEGAQWVVRRGDTLWALARRMGTTVDALVAANGITDPDRIRVGQVLKMPGAMPPAPVTASTAPVTSPVPQPRPETPAPETPAPASETPAPASETPAPAEGQTPATETQTETLAETGTQTEPTVPSAEQDAALQPAIDAVLAIVPADQRAYATDTVPAILKSCLRRNIGVVDQVAYILATAQHESRFGKPLYSRSESLVEDHNPYRQNRDGTWSATVHTSGAAVSAPDADALDVAYWDAAYGHKLDNNPGTEDAANYRGRGFVQLTGRTNYADMTDRLTAEGFSYSVDGETYGSGGTAIDLLAHPDHVNRVPELAAEILVLGSEQGSFTGKALGDYIDSCGTDFYNARSVINGDKKKNGLSIAGLAEDFSAALAPIWPTLFLPIRS
ncbi:MAG: LysM peptidoglycan-binding domain-containing protein [Myxococcota bacterium]